MMEEKEENGDDLGERIREQRRGLRRERKRKEEGGRKGRQKEVRNGEREEGQIKYRARNREDRGRGWKTGAQPQVEERLERQETESTEAK